MICPYCKRLIHPNSFSCAYCGSFVANYRPNRAPAANTFADFASSQPAKNDANQSHLGSAFERQEEDQAQRAGDRGEEWLRSHFETYSRVKDVHLFAGKRIPAGRQRREIDLLAVTPRRLYVFDAKYWTGRLFLQGNTWVQIRRNGQRRKCEDPIAATLGQAQALLQFLDTKGIVISPKLISHKVFFVESSLQIDDAIAQHRDVLYPAKLSQRINAQAIIDYCLSQDRHDPDGSRPLEVQARQQFSKIVGEIHQLRTWDRIFLPGGRSQRGDVKQIKVGEDVFFQDDFAPGFSIQVQWPHGNPNTLLQQLLGVKPGMLVVADDQKFPVGTDDYIMFHKAGQAEPTMIPLEKLEKIVIG